MKKHEITIGRVLVLLAGAGLLPAISAQAQGVTLQDDEAVIISDARELAGAKRATFRASVSALMSARGKRNDEELVETGRHQDNSGRNYLRFEQKLNGLRIHGAYVKAAFDASGTPIQVIERMAPTNRAPLRAGIGAGDALRAALGRNFPGVNATAPVSTIGETTSFGRGTFFWSSPTAERVLISRKGGLEEGFLVETWSAVDNQLFHTLVDSKGAVVSNELRTASERYNIFAVNPTVSAQTIVSGPAPGGTVSPQGWLGTGAQTTVNISGNNAHAYLDVDANNSPDAGGTTVTNGDFLTAASLTTAPSTTQNRAVAVQNLFYLTNVTHDRLYRLGFNEAQGNFQENNFGLGGLGLDSVLAEAQDGSGTDNANFAAPADGTRPRMQMYLWTATNPQRDGDLDSDVVYHEYGHGLTWRTIGNMSGDISGAIGEGMSDVVAILFNLNDVVGEYSTNNANGIRSARYGAHPDTFANFNRTRGVHRNGEIYAATIWDLWLRYQAAGFSADFLMTDLIGGTNFTPAGPSYINMRDGILAFTPASRDCMVWRAFAGRGMGVGAAQSRVTGRPTTSFTVPAGC